MSALLGLEIPTAWPKVSTQWVWTDSMVVVIVVIVAILGRQMGLLTHPPHPSPSTLLPGPSKYQAVTVATY